MLLGKDPTAKPGDFNRDGKVDAADYNFWKSANGNDRSAIHRSRREWRHEGRCQRFAFWAAAVPEPTSAVLFSIGFARLRFDTSGAADEIKRHADVDDS